MNIHLKPEQERVIGQAIQAGLIQAADDVVEVGVETIRQRLEARLASRSALGAEEWSRELHDWVHSHSTTETILSDEAISRDSIYDTRGVM
jgi:Arc/MetJ-type ribon-helix-helix transcriptional regulator